MKAPYKQVAIAAGGIVVAAMAARLLRNAAAQRPKYVAQAMTVTLARASVIRALEDSEILTRALGCDHALSVSASSDGRVYGWTDDLHPERSGRLALIAAPGQRGTELHIAMRARKCDVKDVVRKLKALLEAGEISTGATYA
jgi:hypothetical protein